MMVACYKYEIMKKKRKSPRSVEQSIQPSKSTNNIGEISDLNRFQKWKQKWILRLIKLLLTPTPPLPHIK